MILSVFSLYDFFTGEYQPPIYARSEEHAISLVNQAIEGLKDKTILADYCLYCLGSFDSRTGVLDPCLVKVEYRFDAALEKAREKAEAENG